MKMYLADTKVVVNNIKNKKIDQMYICEATIFEMLKNKTDFERRKQFKNIVEHCVRTNSNFLLSDPSMNLLDNDRFCGYLYALKICDSTARKMAEMLFTFFNIVITIVQLLKISDYQSKKRIENAELLIRNTSLVLMELEKECTELIYRAFFENSSDKNDNDLVKIYNDLVKHINAHSKDEKYQLNIVKTLSISEMVSGGSLEKRVKYVEQYVDKVLTFRKSPKENKLFFKTYLIYLFTKKNLFETNDLIDINISYAAYANNLELVTTDTNLEKAYNSLIKIRLVK